jgi:hypothetical protein
MVESRPLRVSQWLWAYYGTVQLTQMMKTSLDQGGLPDVNLKVLY